MGICNVNPNPVMTTSYSEVLFEHPFIREKEYGITASSTETNKISIPARFLFILFSSPIGLLEAPLKYFHHFWGIIIMTSSCRRSVVRGELSGTGELPENKRALDPLSPFWGHLVLWSRTGYFAKRPFGWGRLSMYFRGSTLEISLER